MAPGARRRCSPASWSDVRLSPSFSRPPAPSPPAGSPRPRRFHCTTRWRRRRRRRAELAGLPWPQLGEPGRRAACSLLPRRGPRPPRLPCPPRPSRRVPPLQPPAGRCRRASATTRSTAPSARATSLWSSGPRTSSPRPRYRRRGTARPWGGAARDRPSVAAPGGPATPGAQGPGGQWGPHTGDRRGPGRLAGGCLGGRV